MEAAHPATQPTMTRHKCDICDRVFTRKDNLVQHRDTVHGRGRHQCSTCGKVFTRLSNLTRHYNTAHSNQTLLTDTPSAADRQTIQPSSVTDRKTHQPTLVTDTYTNQLASASQTARTATNTIALKPQTMYDEISNIKRVKTYNNHSNLNLGNPIIPIDKLTMTRYTCEICERVFTLKQHLTRHHDTVHGRQRHPCTTCGKVFTRRENLMNHYKKAHTNQTLITDTPSPSDTQTEQSPAATLTDLTATNTSLLKRHRMYDDVANNKRVKTHSDSNINLENDIFPKDDLTVIRYTCELCERVFTRKNDLKRHHDSVHNRQRHTCRECWEVFTRLDNLTTHYKTVHRNQTLPSTTTSPTDTPSATNRQSIQLPAATLTDSTVNNNDSNLNSHTDIFHVDDLRGDALDLHLEDINEIDLPLDEIDTLCNLNRELQTIYIDNWDAIQTHANTGKHLSTFNFFHNPLDTTPIDWSSKLTDTIFTPQTKRFKINYSHHTILKHKETGEYRFFHSSNNNACVLELPKLIHNRQDFKDFLHHLNNADILNYAQHTRPNTKYAVEVIPATTFFLYHLNEYPIE
jgi:uncharacterized C2H2 Zn-finger protein